MKTYDEFINGLYDNTINDVLVNIEENYHEEVKSSYKEYLDNLYNDYNNRNDYDKLYNTFSIAEKNKWHNMPVDTKEGLLIKDEALTKILDISLEIYELVNNNEEIGSKDYLDELEKLEKEVLPFNKGRAALYISEAENDLNSVLENDNQSFRMSH